MWDISQNCWNVKVEHYQEALTLMENYANFHRGIKV
jgi:hypothetical protein